MKIAYVVNEDISGTSGVAKKIRSKVDTWESLGHDITVISLQSKDNSTSIENGIILSTINRKDTKLGKIIKWVKNVFLLKKELRKTNPDMVYMRYILYIPFLVSSLKVKSNYIIEINTDDINELRLKSKPVYYYNLFTRSLLYKNALAFVGVTNELITIKSIAKFKKPSICIANGIDVPKYNKYLRKQTKNEEKKIVFIGTPNQKWHGIEKILYLASKLINHKFEIIGYSKNELKGIAQENQLEFSKNITAHGYLNEDDANTIITKCDIGIGTLSLYKTNMQEASPLKVRHYMAMGLGVIIGYNDTDLDPKLEFVLELENSFDNIKKNIDKIQEFVSTYQVNKSAVISFARRKLDYKQKEIERLEFINSVIEKDLRDE